MDTRQPSVKELHYVLNHVFLPPQLPQYDDLNEIADSRSPPGDDWQPNIALCQLAYDAAVEFPQYLSDSQKTEWAVVIKMLASLLDTTKSFKKEELVKKILQLENRDALVFDIRAQNAGLILRKNAEHIVFEAFEVAPPPGDVMAAEGKLRCSYPGPAVELPLNIAQDSSFVAQFVSFLNHMDLDKLDAAETTTKAGSEVEETRSTSHPKYITQLLIAILHGLGQEADIKRITKRIADDVCWDNARNPWRRAPLWLVMRVAIQTTSESREVYKAWMLFFHARLLQLFLDNRFSSDLLFTARVKTGRRAYKLGELTFPPLLMMVKNVGEAVQELLQERWSEEQHLQAISPTFTPDPSAIEKDTTLTLFKSRPYLTNVLRPEPYSYIPTEFLPNQYPRLRDRDIASIYPNGLASAVQADPYVALADFEFLVQERLSAWTAASQHLSEPSACKILGSCLDQYISAAKSNYESNPEDQSLMLLTILDLWVALDTLACSKYPLLRSYSPEIPSSILEPLLIRRTVSLDRAAAIEQYLRRRHSDASNALPSIYSTETTYNTFGVRYFEQSSSLKAIKSSIEQHATDERARKCAELQTLNDQHRRLMREIAELQCEYHQGTDRWGYIYSNHSYFCRKCELQRQADRMCINVHEWPLPSGTFEAKATVFELKCPPDFAIWRTWTYQILRDIGMAHISTAYRKTYALEDYNGLERWSKKGTSGRIVFASETKSFLVSHYHDTKIPADDDRVCVNNGFQFQLFDSIRNEPVYSAFDIMIHPYCTLRLPENGLYGHLQYAVAHTTHSHNSTIVKQGDCPVDLGMHEQLAFSNLRCGSQLQWMNVARELRTRVLTFSSDEVHTLITQAAWQMGPLSDDGFSWHSELQLVDFGSVLLREATDLLSHVEDNWMEGNTVKSIIYIVGRLLASATDTQVYEKGYALLRKTRDITHKWMREIVQKLQAVVNDENAISELQRRACEMAATCRATFDVDTGDHLHALLSSATDVAILIECAIVVHDNIPRHLGDAFPDFQKLLHRDRRLHHFLESHLIECIQADRCGLDNAIISVWPEYRRGNQGWQQLPESNSRWVTSSTDPLPSKRAQRVHYNVLSGKLLIDGKSLGRLPEEIVNHSTYARIFGQKILDVIPADMPGMDYATRYLIHGYQLFFAFRSGAQNPTIRARGHTGQTFELIPHHILAADLPYFFSEDYVHWMDINTGRVEFRPLKQLWQQSSLSWCLDFSLYGPSAMVYGGEGTRKLVDIHSETFQGIAARLRPLEYSDYLTITADYCQLHPVSIELPRFRLSFFLNNDNELESSNMQGMVIDNNQCTGTMIGLRTQLVLCNKEPKFASLPRSRQVLIPHGEVQYSISSSTNHVDVKIDTHREFCRQVVWHKYDIDSDLGILVGNINLTSRLFKIYLHALCSHPLPDPLTSQRGTDYALQELGAASCFSFQQLMKTDVDLLCLIGKISPTRDYYPKHLQGMQTTRWSPLLPVLSQHGGFDTAVFKIMEYARSLTVFPGLQENTNYKCHGNPMLMARAMRRHAVYYEARIDSSSDFDRCYHSRDRPHNTPAEIEALKVSRLVYTWPGGFVSDSSAASFDLLKIFQSWGIIEGLNSTTSLIYSSEWLHLDLPAQWLSTYELCRQIEQPNSKYKLIFSFASLAYSNEPNLLKHIPVLLAVATIDRSRLPEPPQYPSYDLGRGFEPHREQIQEIFSSKIYDLYNSPAAHLSRQSGEDPTSFKRRVQQYYEDCSQSKINNAVVHLLHQWPSSDPRSPFYGSDANQWFRIEEIMNDVKKYFASCSRNSELRTFTSQISRILQDTCRPSPLTGHITPEMRFSPQFDIAFSTLNPSFTLQKLLSNREMPLDLLCVEPSSQFGLTYERPAAHLDQSIGTSALANLIIQFENAHRTALHQRYCDRLKASQRELHGQPTSILHTKFKLPMDLCLEYRGECQTRLSCVFLSICDALKPFTCAEIILKDAGLWPPLSRRTVLQLLTSAASAARSAEWSEILVTFAKAFIEYQHAQRLVAFCLRSEVNGFLKELDNASFNYSDARENPEWLLIQIDGNFITRPIQSRVAMEMIAPSSWRNTALQLNMGEGKSHVIVPLVAAVLADSQKLVRVVVLKPLAKQMFQLLVERLSGLANHRIFYLPFSRDVKASPQVIENIRHLFQECARVRGILVAQPEHILSFRLMVVEQILSSNGPDLSQTARHLQATQRWLTCTSRDILDESDELLHVRYQLIYTMDQQQPLEDSPDRWITIQQVFDLVRQHMRQLHQNFSEDVELVEHHTGTDKGKFPHFRLLGTPASEALVAQIAENALNGMVENINFVGLGSQPPLRSAVLRFITIRDVDCEAYHTVQDIYGLTGLWKGLLLLRGLLAHGILVYVLSRRRWRVDYGLDPKRSLLAVPYRAKDVPSLRSEFGHPDIVICLTCLSYYYGGLTYAQVRECFEIVSKLDNPSLEYESWVKRGRESIPVAIRQFIGVNIKDVDTFTRDVIPVFQHNKGIIDFYLSRVVFPKEAKEFPFKLGTSGWDLAETKANFTTGFSGTNDNSDLLPTSITQSDPVNQLRTNAQVLEYLLRPENNSYLCTQAKNGEPCSAAELLNVLVKEPREIRVLLDVGAQMLEMSNQKLVERWLSLTSVQDVAAGIFFDDADNLSVLTRDGLVEPLYSSPFIQRLYQCIIYLDDSHTRGTDLKLPPDFRALVTLGPKVTKDKLVQGCMRMRNLGHGQSVVFCAPLEVDRRIRRSETIDTSHPVQVIDVLSWAMSNTCTDIQDHIPHWIQQGIYYHQRQDGNSAFSVSNDMNVELLKAPWLQPAARSLDELYGLQTRHSYRVDVVKIQAMHDHLETLGTTEFCDESMAEEQEREVSHELEEESQLERPPQIPAAVHQLDEEVRSFVQRGVIPANSKIFLPLMSPLRSQSNTLSPQNPWSKRLLGTRDFMTTTTSGKERFVLTEYLRPVNWIVSHVRADQDMVLVVMSPYEVDALLENIRNSQHVRLHIYAPRTSQSMEPFDDLAFYCIPPLSHGTANKVSLSNDTGYQLNVWAGQLFLDKYETYLRLCLLLGLSSSESEANSSVETDRFVPEGGRTNEMTAVCLFDKSPLPLLKVLFGLRRKGMSFRSTHMGKILQARLLLWKDFEE